MGDSELQELAALYKPVLWMPCKADASECAWALYKASRPNKERTDATLKEAIAEQNANAVKVRLRCAAACMALPHAWHQRSTRTPMHACLPTMHGCHACVGTELVFWRSFCAGTAVLHGAAMAASQWLCNAAHARTGCSATAARTLLPRMDTGSAVLRRQ
jgi:hypothetical protein